MAEGELLTLVRVLLAVRSFGHGDTIDIGLNA
jgi:hypothetical protein